MINRHAPIQLQHHHQQGGQGQQQHLIQLADSPLKDSNGHPLYNLTVAAAAAANITSQPVSVVTTATGVPVFPPTNPVNVGLGGGGLNGGLGQQNPDPFSALGQLGQDLR